MGEPKKYWISFPSVVGSREFPVEGYQGRAVTRMEIHVNFLQFNVW